MTSDLARLAFPDPPNPPEKPWKRGSASGRVEFSGLTTETLAAFRASWAAHEQEVRTWSAACDNIAGAAARLLIERGFPAEVRAWTERGNRERYGRRTEMALNVVLRGAGPVYRPERPSLFAEEEWLRLASSRERDHAAKQEATALRDRAIAWLLVRGNRYGEDFTADTATTRALHVAASEEIEAMPKDQRHEFVGWNCNDFGERECKGWDGDSQRCHCGNRRVSWQIEGTFEAPRVYGEAY